MKNNPFTYTSVLNSQVEFPPKGTTLEIPKIQKYTKIKFPNLKNYNLSQKSEKSLKSGYNSMGTIGKEVFPVKNIKNEIIQIRINPKNLEGLEKSDIKNVNQPKFFNIDCNKLRYPTNKKDVFYKTGKINKNKKLKTLFTNKMEKRKKIISRVYKQCFENFEFEDNFDSYERFLKENTKGDLVNADLLRIFSFIDDSTFSITDLKDILLYAPTNSTIIFDKKIPKKNEKEENKEFNIRDQFKENMNPDEFKRDKSKINKKFFEGKKNHRDYTMRELNLIMDKLESSRNNKILENVLGDIDKLESLN